jgi:hypothetical protein
MRNTQYLVAVALLSASVLAGGSPEQPANKNTPARAQREQDADARVHKTPAQVEGALKATVARGEHDDAAANFAEAHARAGGAAARALEAPANAAQVTNLPKLGALAAGRRQLSPSLIEHPVGLYSTQTEAASSPNQFNFVTTTDCFIKACCAAGWSGRKTCEATSPKGRTHKNDLTVITGTDGGIAGVEAHLWADVRALARAGVEAHLWADVRALARAGAEAHRRADHVQAVAQADGS